MRQRMAVALIVLTAVASTVAFLGWPRFGGEFARGSLISAGQSRDAEVWRWTNYGLVPYLTVHDDYNPTQGHRQSYSLHPLPACLTSVLVVAVWVAAVRLFRSTRTPASPGAG